MVVLATLADGDRVAGGDLRRVLGHAPGRRARLPAAADDPPHLARARSGRSTCPAVNWGIFAAVVALVVGFGSSTGLASAYGIAVTGTLAIDTILFFFVVRVLWHRPLWLVLAGAALFLIVDLAFFAREPHEGPARRLVPAHHRARHLRRADDLAARAASSSRATAPRRRARCARSSRRSARLDPPVYRSPGTAVFLNAGKETTPLAMRANVEHNNTLHAQRRDPLDRDAQRPERARARAGRSSTTSATATTASATSPRGSASRTTSTSPRLLELAAANGLEGDCDVEHRLLLPLAHDDRAPPPRPAWPVAQAALHGRRAQRVQPGRLLRAAGRPHGRHGLARDVLTPGRGSPRAGEARSSRGSHDPAATRPRWTDGQAVRWRDQPRHPGLDPGLDAVARRPGAGGRAERPDRPLRRHRPRGVVAVRRADPDADDGPASGGRADLLAVAHDGAVRADALVLPDRAQPPSELVRDDRRDRRPGSPATTRTSRWRTPSRPR